MNKAVGLQKTSLNVAKVKDAYKIPGKTTETVKSEAETLKKYLKTSITYELPNNQSEVLNSEKMLTWLVKNEDGTYSYNEEIWNKRMKNFV